MVGGLPGGDGLTQASRGVKAAGLLTIREPAHEQHIDDAAGVGSSAVKTEAGSGVGDRLALHVIIRGFLCLDALSSAPSGHPLRQLIESGIGTLR